jgi:hypothetical protein
MKTVAARIVLGLMLFVVGAACWSEGQLTRRVADAHRRLATLHYDGEDHIGNAGSLWNRLPWPAGSSEGDVRRHRATVSYWLSHYDSLADRSLATDARPLADSQMLLIAANASWRAVPPPATDRRATVERLDAVIQAYADVLRRDQGAADAAFNYEFVSKVRDALAKGPPGKRGPMKGQTVEKPEHASVDLPAGPTVHGRPGGPPEGTDTGDFKTISPMRYDEREEQIDPGEGKAIKRKG